MTPLYFELDPNKIMSLNFINESQMVFDAGGAFMDWLESFAPITIPLVEYYLQLQIFE